MTRQRLRIFVSSPGDVMAAREVAAQVIEKVAHEYARFFAIEPYLWEYEPMLASGHFQDSIDPPSRFDAVILILESRLGAPLPERTAVREYRGIDGRTPVTGTEWEFEDALAAAHQRGVPDLLVYRSERDAVISTWDARGRKAVLAQLEALDAFWSRHFNDQGTFIGGYAKYKSLEDFASKLEQDLRRCLQRRVAALRPEERNQSVRLWPAPPFRGLEAYRPEHAPIFFGREQAIGAALLRLITDAQGGRPFLLVLGSSGSGKSSLVMAGVIPRLLIPQRVSGLAFQRRVVFRPGDAQAQEDLFDAFARCLTREEGSGTGLPELLGSSMSVRQLAHHLRESTAHPDLPFAMVLDRLAETARAQGRMLRYEEARLILEVDQLEELYTAERVQPEERRRFVQLLAALVHSRLVWVIATMRSDFWHRADETPELIELAEGHGRIHLRPPTPAELSQMIRGPAEAAAIHFETHPATGIPLNDVIAEAAAGEPGALPLLSYLLDQLYHRDIQQAGGATLTYASYEALGGLQGAIATRADAVIAAQSIEVRQALRQVLFALVQMTATEGGGERAVARRAPLRDFPQGTAKRRLIEALTDPAARLLVADGVDGHAASVRLAHEALISEWQTAREYVAGNAEALRSRRVLEERYTRWRAIVSQAASSGSQSRLRSQLAALRAHFSEEHGLLADVDLADARRLLRDYREDLSPELVRYIERSIDQERRRHQRTVRAVTAAAAMMSVLAIGAAYEAKIASAQRDAAREAQMRSLTQTAAAHLREGDVPGAMALVLEVLPHQGAPRAFTAEALSVFQEARARDTQVATINGNSGRMWSGAFSPDGSRIVTASDDGTARVWDVLTGEQVLLLRGHSDRVFAATFSPDGRQIVTASYDGIAHLWDAATGRKILSFLGHGGKLWYAAFSPDGRRVATASSDKTARVWDTATGRELLQLKGHAEQVSCATFSPDGLRIVTASSDKTARIWDATTGRQLMPLSGHTEVVVSAQFSPDGKRIVTASNDKTARLWDAATGRNVMLLSGHTDRVRSAAFSPDGRRIVTASTDRTARVWDSATGAQIMVLSGHADMLETAAFSPDGRRIVTASPDKTVRIWDAETAAEVRELSGHADRVFAAAFSPDGRRIATASYDYTARIWEAATGALLGILRGHTNRLFAATFSPDGQRLVTGSDDKTARVWDVATSRELAQLRGHKDRVYSAAFSPDGARIVTASDDRTARIWDAATGRELLVLSGHGDLVETAVFSPNGRQVLTASSDRTARIWDAMTGRVLLRLSGHTDVVSSAAYSPDGQRVVTASNDKTARVWDATTGEALQVLSGHTDQLNYARFSPDGRRIITASNDNTARIWDAVTARELLVLSGHTAAVQDAGYSADGHLVVTASADKTARIWDPSSAALEAQIEWAAAAQFAPLSNTERFQLGLAAPTDVRRWEGDRSKCDQAAAAPYDPARRAPGLMLEQIVSDIATQACAQQAAHPDSTGRTAYQHGRAVMAGGDFVSARRDFEQALAAGYRAARLDLAMLLSQPAAGMLDVPRAISLSEQAWKEGITMAAFELGGLYEHGVHRTGSAADHNFTPDEARAWHWYQQGAEAGEPNALARFAQREDHAAFATEDAAGKRALMLQAFRYYASACERARLENWPEAAWQNWQLRRASLARLLARAGMTEQVAEEYAAVCRQYAPRRTLWQRLGWTSGVTN